MEGNLRFKLGRVVSTQGVRSVIAMEEILKALARHHTGDWGEVCEADREANELAVQEGERLLSVYRSSEDVAFWIITEADRTSTTVLLPEEY